MILKIYYICTNIRRFLIIRELNTYILCVRNCFSDCFSEIKYNHIKSSFRIRNTGEKATSSGSAFLPGFLPPKKYFHSWVVSQSLSPWCCFLPILFAEIYIKYKPYRRRRGSCTVGHMIYVFIKLIIMLRNETYWSNFVSSSKHMCL
jgi:hypothetical protein